MNDNFDNQETRNMTNLDDLSPSQYLFVRNLRYYTHGLHVNDIGTHTVGTKGTLKALVRKGWVCVDEYDVAHLSSAAVEALRADEGTATLKLRRDDIESRARHAREVIRSNARYVKYQGSDRSEQIINAEADHLVALTYALAEGPDADGNYNVRW